MPSRIQPSSTVNLWDLDSVTLPMAQYSPKSASYFDANWKPRLRLATKVLQDAQNDWLLSEASFPTELLSVIFVFLFRTDFTASVRGDDGITRRLLYHLTLDEWRDLVQNPLKECGLLLPSATDQQRMKTVLHFESVLENAVASWREDAFFPTPNSVVLECAEWLADRKLIKLR